MIQPHKYQLFPDTLKRFQHPKKAFKKTFELLNSRDWELVVKGLTYLVRLARHHPETLELHQHTACDQLARIMRYSRSHVVHAACQAAAEIFTCKTKFLERDSHLLVDALLLRTVHTNHFLRTDAQLALDVMCDNFPLCKTLEILDKKAAHHKDPAIRSVGGRMLRQLGERLGVERVFNLKVCHLDTFFKIGAALLNDSQQKTREEAKLLFSFLARHPEYKRMLKLMIPATQLPDIERSIERMRHFG